MKNLLRFSTMLVALAFGGVAQADRISITESPDLYDQSQLPNTSVIRVFYENLGATTDTINNASITLRIEAPLDADTNNNLEADGFAAISNFNTAGSTVLDTATGQTVILGGFVTFGTGATVAPGAIVELFRFTVTLPAGTPIGIYPITYDPASPPLVVGPNVNVTQAIAGNIVVTAIPEPASVAMVSMAGLVGLGALARRRLVRKAD